MYKYSLPKQNIEKSPCTLGLLLYKKFDIWVVFLNFFARVVSSIKRASNNKPNSVSGLNLIILHNKDI